MRDRLRFKAANLPLRVRLTLWYSASLALILLLFATFIYFQLRRSLVAQVDVGLDIVAQQSLINIDVQDGRLAFQNIEDNPDVAGRINNDFVMISLLSPDGSRWDFLGDEEEALTATQPVAGYSTVTAGNEQWRVYYQPVGSDGLDGWLQVVQEMEPVHETLRTLLSQMMFALPAAILVAALGGLFLASRALRPVDRITQTARTITANDLHRRVGYRGPLDEVGRLAVTIDEMLARLEAGFERERRFTADTAHELRTPLAALKGRIGVTLSRARRPVAYVETLNDMEQQVDRLIRLSNDLLFMTRLQQGERRIELVPMGLADFLAAVIDQARPAAEAKAIRLTESVPGDIIISGQIDLLTRLFLNLLDNAVKYTPAGGWVSVSAQTTTGLVHIAVSDSGPGIAPQHLPHLFERFYRVESDRARQWDENGQAGAGLGLALAHEIARLHGGALSVESRVGEGATFIVSLPERS